MKRLLLASLLLSFREEVLSFAPTTFLSKKTPVPKLVTRPVSTSSSAEKDTSGTSTVETLRKLLDRQESEVKETKRLLKTFESPAGDDRGNDAIKRSPSTAVSIESGFDYGFVSRSEGASFSEMKGRSPEGYGPPSNIFSLGAQQFIRNYNAILGEYRDEEPIDLSPKQQEYHDRLDQLSLSSDAIRERDLANGPIIAPVIIKIPYIFLCFMLDTVFAKSSVPSRFFLLETVARMPYFSYISMLHLYETLGFWRRSADVKRIHFAEEINEFNHLLIMESLGGDQSWWVRFLAQHSAVVYYFVLCGLWALSPSLSYRFSELLETHAVNTYGQFLDENEASLKELPPSFAAVKYYAFGSSDPFYAEFQTTALAQGHEVRFAAT
jgi:ubiquinol oxidase